jgi:5-methylcytosine-specific restriction endonuclease McrA
VTPRLDTSSRFDGQRGPNGFSLCRQCGDECDNKRQTYCSPACVAQWKLERWPTVQRRHVWERDGGVCRSCGFNVKRFERRARWISDRLGARSFNISRLHGPAWTREFNAIKRNGARLERCVVRVVARYRFKAHRANWLPHFWEMDHCVPLAEGGTNELENLRVLCVPCHRAETKALAGRLAQRRKQA